MRAFWIVGGLLVAVCVAGCGDDPIPESVPAQLVRVEREPNAEAVAIEVQAVEEADADSDGSPRWEGDRLLVRLTRPAFIYPVPGQTWQALEEAPEGTQVSIDSQTEYGGEVWLRLLLDHGGTGWLRLQDSGTTRQEVGWLPEIKWSFPSARLRWDQVAIDLGADPPGHAFWVDNVHISHWLLGRSADSRRVAIRLLTVKSESFVIWVNSHSAEFEQSIDSLPIYLGECCIRELPKRLAIAEIVSHAASISIRPHGEPEALTFEGGDGEQFPIIGRSPDAMWIALRVSFFDRGYVWIPIEHLRLNVEVNEIPIFIGTATEALSTRTEESTGLSYAITEGFETWRWLPDGRFIGISHDGMWQWKPEIRELREVADASAPVVSPDGSYAAYRQCPKQSIGTDCWRDVVITSAKDGGQLVFPNVAFDGQYKVAQDRLRPWLTWSPNSRYLLNVAPAMQLSAPDQLEVLRVDGSRNSLPDQDWARWLADSTLLTRNELGYHVYRADGLRLRTIEFEFSEWVRPVVSSGEPLMVAAGQASSSGEPTGFYLIDLRTGELTRLPPPLDRWSLESDGRANWEPLLFSGASLYFYLDDAGVDMPDEHDRLLRLHLSSGNVSPVRGLRFRGHRWSWASFRCLDECQTFVVSFNNFDHAPVFIVESEALDGGHPKVTEVEDSQPTAHREIQGWSPDGAKLLLRKDLSMLPYDEQGFAIPYRRGGYAHETWGYAEYQIVDSADGRITQRYRAVPRDCGGIYHRGEWSPDSRWLVVASEVRHCR